MKGLYEKCWLVGYKSTLKKQFLKTKNKCVKSFFKMNVFIKTDIYHIFLNACFRTLLTYTPTIKVMKKGTLITEIMTTDVITLNKKDSLNTAEILFKTHKIRHIPVVNKDEIVGMLSYTDLLRISFADAVYEDEETIDTVVYNMFTIEQVMAKKLVSVTSNTTIKEVVEILSKKEFHALPIVDNNKLMGIVTTTDLLNYLLKQF